MRLLAKSSLSVGMEQLGSDWKDFDEILYFSIFRKSVEKIQVSLNSDKNNGTLQADLCMLLIVSRSVLFRMRNVLDKSYRENENTHFIYRNFFF